MVERQDTYPASRTGYLAVWGHEYTWSVGSPHGAGITSGLVRTAASALAGSAFFSQILLELARVRFPVAPCPYHLGQLWKEGEWQFSCP